MHTVEFTIFLYHYFLKKFRETNFFRKEFTIKLFSRNNSQVIQKFRKLHTVQCKVCQIVENQENFFLYFLREINLDIFYALISRIFFFFEISEITTLCYDRVLPLRHLYYPSNIVMAGLIFSS